MIPINTEPERHRVKGVRQFSYWVGRIPGVGLTLSVQSLRKDSADVWRFVGRIRYLGTSPRAMRIARLIGRL